MHLLRVRPPSSSLACIITTTFYFHFFTEQSDYSFFRANLIFPPISKLLWWFPTNLGLKPSPQSGTCVLIWPRSSTYSANTELQIWVRHCRVPRRMSRNRQRPLPWWSRSEIRIVSKITTMVNATKERHETAVWSLIREGFQRSAYFSKFNIYLWTNLQFPENLGSALLPYGLSISSSLFQECPLLPYLPAFF